MTINFNCDALPKLHLATILQLYWVVFCFALLALAPPKMMRLRLRYAALVKQPDKKLNFVVMQYHF
jgi:hypothetical protein